MTFLMIGTTEIILIAVVALLLFGGKKLPELMRGMGQGVRSFKEGMQDMTNPQAPNNAQPNEQQPAAPQSQTTASTASEPQSPQEAAPTNHAEQPVAHQGTPQP